MGDAAERKGVQVPLRTRLLKIGIYEVPEAARLAGLKPAQLRRWLGGREAPPLWRTELPVVEDRIGLGFHDLVQARILGELVRQGLHPRLLRRLVAEAREMLRTEHPLAHARFRTDGKRLYLELLEEERRIYDLDRRQYGFHRVIEPSLKSLEYHGEMAARWWPLGRNTLVVLDPERAFGKPVASESGVPTATLFEQYVVHGSYRRVARIFDVREREVRDAVRFEKTLADRGSRTLRAA